MTMFNAGGVFSLVLDLVARKEFETALAELHAELGKNPDNPPLQQQLADVLAISGRVTEAADTLVALAESFAAKGQTAKAIAVLKRVEVLDPLRGDQGGRLARLVKNRDEERRSEIFTFKRRAEVAPELSPHETSTLIETVFGKREEAAGDSSSPDNEDKTDKVMVFRDLPPGELLEPEQPEAEAEVEVEPTTARAALSPLFGSFSAEELEAVIQGLRLLTFEPGEIVVSEGERGASLFVLTTGTVKAFVRDAGGKNRRVRQLTEGSFFGEVSILTGKSRSATIVASTACELLELDRPTLDQILATHPRVLSVLQAFSAARVMSAAESLARRGE